VRDAAATTRATSTATDGGRYPVLGLTNWCIR
jgi:hypothetical protein